MDDCCGVCCICIACCGFMTSAFRYLPFQYVCRCRRWKNDEDDEDIDKMKFPDHEPMFTADGERIQQQQRHHHNPYTGTAPMEMQANPSSSSSQTAVVDPDAPPAFGAPSAKPQPPDYSAAVRDAIRSDEERPLGYRPEREQGQPFNRPSDTR